MAKYRLELIKSLARQMVFVPLTVRETQLQAAEELALSLDSSKAYPPEYVVFRITGYTPKPSAEPAELITGLALQHDLGLLVEQVSETLNHKTTDRIEPVLTISDLTIKFNVASKTIQRWRRRGLTARRFIFPDGKKRVGFRLSVVQRFIELHREAVERGANFSQVHSQERDLILARARRLANQCHCCIGEISRRIARKLNRSPLTIQATIRKHDAENPQEAIFTAAAKPLSDEQKQQVLHLIDSGYRLTEVAKAFRRPRVMIYRVLLEARLNRLIDRRVKFIDDPLYHHSDAQNILDQMVNQETLDPAPTVETSRIPSDLPPYLRELYRIPLLSPTRERALFLKYHFQKYQFIQARKKIDPAHARIRDVQKLEQLLNRVAETKNQIVQANLRLVVSVARKHLRKGLSLMELVSEGNLTLMRAVESFDVHKGYKFSTYATLALMKGYARSVPQMLNQNHRLVHTPSLEEHPQFDSARELVEHREQVRTLLSVLNDRERSVIEAHFGIRTDSQQGIEDLARQLGVSRQRIRQIEKGALDKLRQAAGVWGKSR